MRAGCLSLWLALLSDVCVAFLRTSPKVSLSQVSPHEEFKAPYVPPGVTPEWVEGNPLAQYFWNYEKGPVIWKWHHYFGVYHKHLQKLRGQKITMLVIGVQSGGEIGMWQNYFGEDKLQFWGVDINPACKSLEKKYINTHILVGDQGDKTSLTTGLDEAGVPAQVDIVIDDGSHIIAHQKLTYETLFWRLKKGGIFITEDTSTSYTDWNPAHHAGSTENFVDFMKRDIDAVNGYYVPGEPSKWTKNVKQVHFYDSMVVSYREDHSPPVQEQRGTEEIPYCTKGQANSCYVTKADVLQGEDAVVLALHESTVKNISSIQGFSANSTSGSTQAPEAITNASGGIKRFGMSPHDDYTAPAVPAGTTPEWVNNDLAKYFWEHTTGLKIWKWHHYFEAYDYHLSEMRKQDKIKMLVIGVQSGGEIGMWQNYFGADKLEFYGVDVNPACKKLEADFKNTKVVIGDQGDETFLRTTIHETVPKDLDIIIDDGSHICLHQTLTFDILFWSLKPKGGVFITEDVATSYTAADSKFRYWSSETFVDHMKKGIDSINNYYVPHSAVGDFQRETNQMHFYDSMVVAVRSPHPTPAQEQKGTDFIPYCTPGQKNGCLTL